MPLTTQQRHRLLLADRTKDVTAVIAVIEGMRNKNRGATLAEIEDALRAAAGTAYVIARPETRAGFTVAIGMAAWIAALKQCGVTAEQNRAMLASCAGIALLVADRSRDLELIRATVEDLLEADPAISLLEVEMVFRDGACASYMLVGDPFSIVIGMPAWRDALKRAHMSPEANRQALAVRPSF